MLHFSQLLSADEDEAERSEGQGPEAESRDRSRCPGEVRALRVAHRLGVSMLKFLGMLAIVISGIVIGLAIVVAWLLGWGVP